MCLAKLPYLSGLCLNSEETLTMKSGAVLVEIDPDVQFVGGIYPEEIWHLTPEEWFENRAAFLHRRGKKLT